MSYISTSYQVKEINVTEDSKLAALIPRLIPNQIRKAVDFSTAFF
jgi:hypothetical protein